MARRIPIAVAWAWLVAAPALAAQGADADLEADPAQREGAGSDIDEAVEDEFDLLAEEEKVFSAAKHEQKIGFSPSAVVVITRQEIEALGAVSLADLLRRYPVVNVYAFDPLYPGADMRGSYRGLLLVDNREVSVEWFAAPFYNVLPFGIHDIERVEIILGPNSALYGANAVLSVIHVITRRPRREFGLDAWLFGSDSHRTSLGGWVTGGLGPLALQLTLGLDRNQMWSSPRRLAYEQRRAGMVADWELPAGRLEIDAGLVNGTGSMWTQLGTMSFDHFTFAHAAARYTFRVLEVRAHWYGVRASSLQDFDLVLPNTDIVVGTFPEVHIATDSAQLEVQTNLEPFAGNLLLCGLDLRLLDLRAAQFVDPNLREERAGVFLHDEQRLGERWLLTAGLRWDVNSNTPMALSPQLAVVWNPAGEHFLRLSGGTAFRKPTLMETSIKPKVNINPAFPEIGELLETKGLSDADLENESITSLELGYRGRALEGRLRWNLDASFDMRRNWIGFQTKVVFRNPLQIDIERSVIGYANLDDDTNVLVLSASLEYEPRPRLDFFLRGEYRYPWYTQKEGTFDFCVHEQLLAGFTWRTDAGFGLSLAMAYGGRRREDFRDPTSLLMPTRPRWVPARLFFMGHLGWTIHLPRASLALGLSVSDLFNTRRREYPGETLPDGSNFGGEMVPRELTLSARLQY
ncbi:MAG: TonB-dependent receptor [Myxococcales bacterium]|nr:TonB-dependent receptor [Myxococcales bacterium]